MIAEEKRPNYLLWGFIFISALIHLFLILKICGLISPRHWFYIPIELATTKPSKGIASHLPTPVVPPKALLPTRASALKFPPKDILPVKAELVSPQSPPRESLSTSSEEALKDLEPLAPLVDPQAILGELKAAKSRFQAYATMIRAKIEKAKRYPLPAREMGLEGAVKLRFSLTGQGELLRVEVLRSSGIKILDQAAVEAVKRAAPFPPAPSPYDQEKEISFVITINFWLKR